MRVSHGLLPLYTQLKNMERESSCPRYTLVLNLAGIEFSMTLSQIKKSETWNDTFINVYIHEKGIVPIRHADRKKSKHVNFVLYVHITTTTKTTTTTTTTTITITIIIIMTVIKLILINARFFQMPPLFKLER